MPRPPKSNLLPALCAGTFLGLSAGFARAAEPAPTPPPPNWWDTVHIEGVLDAGVYMNGDNPGDGLNFGHLFTDRANEPVLNQTLLTVHRPIDPTSADYDFGFKAQLMYGSDARYSHFLGMFNYIINDRNQFAPVELHAIAHFPWVFQGGIDIKAGQYVTLLSTETIDPTTNYLYSHTYAFNFGPFQQTGIMTISHVAPFLDVYAGVDTGLNTTFGNRVGDNNSAIAFQGGLGFNLFDGNLTILAATHIGPENPDTPATAAACNCNPNTATRYLNTISAAWKATDSLTLITEGNYYRDNGFNATSYGGVQYAIYKVNDWLKLVGRLEVWRDNNNFFVGAFPGNFDLVNLQMGFPNTAIFGPAPTTYFDITAGLNLSPELPQGTPWLKSLTFRPEVRYDTSLNGTTPYNGQSVPGGRGFPGFGLGTSSNQFTFGGDILARF
ncbi:MAG: outer membrane beta-barrel protein [Beijerinckiaceae bacterium]